MSLVNSVAEGPTREIIVPPKRIELGRSEILVPVVTRAQERDVPICRAIRQRKATEIRQFPTRRIQVHHDHDRGPIPYLPFKNERFGQGAAANYYEQCDRKSFHTGSSLLIH